MEKRTISSYISLVISLAIALFVYTSEEMSFWAAFAVKSYLIFGSVLAIFAAGVLTICWVSVMSVNNLYQAGSRNAMDLYNGTMDAIKEMSSLRLWLGLIVCLVTMAAVARQGWTFILVIYVFSSVLYYGFFHWAMNNTKEMFLKAYEKSNVGKD